MKSKIIIEIETKLNKIVSNDLDEEPYEEDVTEDIENNLHRAIKKYIEDLINDDEFSIKLLDGYSFDYEFGVEDYSDLSDYGEVKILISEKK